MNDGFQWRMLSHVTIERKKHVYMHKQYKAHKTLPFIDPVLIYWPTINRTVKEMEIQLFDQ